MSPVITIAKFGEDRVIKEAIRVLAQGGIVVFPSDTVYGLLVDATNEKAVEKLIAFKNRPPGKAISVFVSGFEMLEQYAELGQKRRLLDTILPGPFTIILKSKQHISHKLESEKGNIGLRLPDNLLVTELVKRYGKPVTATSANLGGKHPHYSIESLVNQLPAYKLKLIDLIVDGGSLPRNKPSTVLDLTADSLKILRHGDIILKDAKNYSTNSAAQTFKLGTYISSTFVHKYAGRPVVCILKGDLGSGKTVLVKGIAASFGINDIVSPTFVISYEYPIDENIKKHYTMFVHADLYNIEDEEEFKHLGLERYVKSGNIMCIEWGERLGKLYDVLAEKAQIIFIEINYISEKERNFRVSTQSLK